MLEERSAVEDDRPMELTVKSTDKHEKTWPLVSASQSWFLHADDFTFADGRKRAYPAVILPSLVVDASNTNGLCPKDLTVRKAAEAYIS